MRIGKLFGKKTGGMKSLRQVENYQLDEETPDITDLTSQEASLLNMLLPTTEGIFFFHELGVKKPTEYPVGAQVFSGFRSALFPKGAAVSIWLLTIDATGSATDANALYVHAEDSALTLGLVVCKSDAGMFHTFHGHYETGSKLRDKLGL